MRAGQSTQSRLGRITSAPASRSAQTRRLLEVDTPARGFRGRAQASSGRHHSALPIASAPQASHRCCHVSPGCSHSQSSSRTSPSRRRRPAARSSSTVNGAASSVASSAFAGLLGRRPRRRRGTGWEALPQLGHVRPDQRQRRPRSAACRAGASPGRARSRGSPPNSTSSESRRYSLGAAVRRPASDAPTGRRSRCARRGGGGRGPRRSRRRASA